MDVYVFEFINPYMDGFIIPVKALSEIQAKTICRNLLRQRGYMATLKELLFMYIDNTKNPVNER